MDSSDTDPDDVSDTDPDDVESDSPDTNDVVEIETREGREEEPNFVFDPDVVEIEPGTTVRWVNTDGVFHTVTSTDSLEEKTPSGEFDATIASEGDTFEWAPETDGVHHYYCRPHVGFMDGSLVVGDAELDSDGMAHEDDQSDPDNDEQPGSDREFVDMRGVDLVTVRTREGDDDADEPAFVFDPAFVRVDQGTSIRWENADGVFHTVTSTDTLERRSGGGTVFNENIGSAGATFEWTAEPTGTQYYYCSPHSGFMFGAVDIV